MIRVMFRKKYEKIPKLYQVFACSSSVEGGRGRVERIFGVCLSVKRIYPKQIWDECLEQASVETLPSTVKPTRVNGKIGRRNEKEGPTF